MNIIQKAIMGLQRVGLANSLRILQFTLYKERMDRKWLRGREGEELDGDSPAVTPGRLVSAQALKGGAGFHFEHADLEIIFLEEDIARLSWGPGEAPLPYALMPRYHLSGGHREVQVELAESRDGCTLTSSAMKIEVSDCGEVRFYDPRGPLLRIEAPPERRGERWRACARLEADTTLYGLGERQNGLNLRNGSYQLWNRDPVDERGSTERLDPLYLTIPVYLALSGQQSYLIFYENPYRGTITFQQERAEATFEGGMLRSYFIPGSPKHALERYSQLTGKAPLPPRWALGYHQSRWGYKSEAIVREVVEGFKEHHLPLSAIHLDIDYMDGFRVFTVDRERFPDLAGLGRELANQGIHIVTILDPGVKTDPNYDIFKEGLERRFFCTLPDGKQALGVVWPGWSAFPDFTSAEVREWWGEKYARLIEAGVSGIWHDMNEPSTIAAWGEFTIPLAARHHLEGRGGDHREAHNLYGLLMNAAGYEGLRRLRPERRPWLLSRSGWAGMQRYAWNWTGDSDSTWEDLRRTIPMVLGLGLSGVPYSGPDVGGFGGNPSAELYLRWFQMGAFLPFFRTHSAVEFKRREPWVYGEPYLSIIREFLKLRYRLLPYLYTLAWESSQTGAPLVRPLFWDDLDQSELREVEDAFLLGDSLLVAPVVEEGARSRQVRLPRGEWYDFWSGEKLTGPGVIEREAPLERIPLLVRAGSILPMEEEDRLILNLYSGNGRGQLYSDCGDGYGPYRLDYFRMRVEGSNLEVTWEQEGDYPFPYQQVEIRAFGIKPERALLDGLPVAWEGSSLTVAPFKDLIIEGEPSSSDS